MTKKQRAMYNAWYNATAVSLDQVYDSFSDEKYRAWLRCIQKQNKDNGICGCIPSHNTFQFTFAYIFEKVNETTGVVETWLNYETAYHTYRFMVTDNSWSVATARYF